MCPQCLCLVTSAAVGYQEWKQGNSWPNSILYYLTGVVLLVWVGTEPDARVKVHCPVTLVYRAMDNCSVMWAL